MIYRILFKLVIQRLDAESAHLLASRALRLVTAAPVVGALIARFLAPGDDRLRVHALGQTFPSPLGVAAGFDKDATSFEGLGLLGFGFVEVGTVTALPQEGNPRPRVLRLPEERALLNAMGFPNPGAKATAERLVRRTGRTVVGVNIGKSRVVDVAAAGADYRDSVRALAPVAEYLVLNVSSPNTPGLRRLQSAELLGTLVTDVRAELESAQLETPILIKIAPDLSDGEVDALSNLALELGLDGIVAVNTTVERDGVPSLSAIGDPGDGGVSGAPLKGRALEVLRRVRALVGDRMVLISVGGIENAADAWERILAGATLVQAYTGLVYGGPLWPRRVNAELARRVRAVGASSIEELVGTAAQPARSPTSMSGLPNGGIGTSGVRTMAAASTTI